MTARRLLAALLLALVGSGLFTFWISKNFSKPVAAASPTQQYVAALHALEPGEILQKTNLTLVDWSGNKLDGGYVKADDLVGRSVLYPLAAGEPILDRQLAAAGSGLGLSTKIPDGMRAVSVRVNEVIGVAGYVLPGNRVDILATASPTDAHQDTITKVILANVQVLTSGTRMEQDQEKGKPMQVTVVTLLVNPEQAERLALASTEGKIQLALRNPLDQGAPSTPGIKTAGLLGAVQTVKQVQVAPAGPGKPAKKATQTVTVTTPAAAALPSVEIIRGDKRATEVIR